MSPGEDEITEWFGRQSKLGSADFPIGIGDDMAEAAIGRGLGVLITTDMLLEGVHFDLNSATVEQVGYKVMAVSLSDCAAMATEPVAAVISVGLPKGFGSDELKKLHAGIVSAGDKYGCALVGGDITSWKGAGRLVVSSAMLSKRAGVEPVRRCGAKVGDVICVTGRLGGAIGGRHLTFEPRVKEAIEIARMVKLNSMIDISDGLSSDLNRICRQSGVGALIEADRIPVSAEAAGSSDPLGSALNDGEDFELLFTLSEQDYGELSSKWQGALSITTVGRITESGKMQIRMADGELKDLQPGGFEHLG